MKRFFLEFDFEPAEELKEDEPRLYGGCYDFTKNEYSLFHTCYGFGSSMKTMRGYISRIKKKYPSQNPHNFRIFDYEAPDEPCGHVGQVYFQAE